MCSMDGCDTAVEAQIQLQMGCRIELDFASLRLNTGSGSGREGQYLHPPMHRQKLPDMQDIQVFQRRKQRAEALVMQSRELRS